jgi:hypothetical protein
MRTRSRVVVSACALLLLLGASARSGSAIDYIGLRISLPIGELPSYYGIELGKEIAFGHAFVSLLFAPGGRTLLLGSVDIPIGEQLGWAATLVRLTAGFSHRAGDFLPGLVGGGGMLVTLHPLASALRINLTGELLYPTAFGPPFFSLEGGLASW